MKSLIKCILASVVTLNSTISLAAEDPRLIAQRLVNSTHQKAQDEAQELVNSDLDRSLYEVMQAGLKAATNSTNETKWKSYQAEIDRLAADVKSLSDKYSQDQAPSQEEILKFWASYKASIRQRFKISFQAQDLAYQDMLFINAAQNAVSKFKNICSTGRTLPAFVAARTNLKGVPRTQFQISIKYSNGGVTDFNSHSSNSTGNDQDAQDFGNALYTAAGITNGIAMSASTGAAVNAAMVAAPYLLAAAAVFAAASYLAADSEQQRLQEQIVEANIMAFSKTATHNDFIAYYKESCADILPLLANLDSAIEDIKTGPTEREKVRNRATSLSSELKEFEQEAATYRIDSQFLSLHAYAKSGYCVLKGNIDENSVCYSDSTAVVDIHNQDIKLPLDIKEANDIIAPKNTRVREFNKKYPKNKRIELATTRIVGVLAEQAEVVSSSLENLAMLKIDENLSQMMNKVQILFVQLRSIKNAEWNRKNPEFGVEINASKTFEQLKARHKKIVSEGVKVVFGKKDRNTFQKEVAGYLVEARAFTSSQYSINEVKSFGSYVESFARIYKTL